LAAARVRQPKKRRRTLLYLDIFLKCVEAASALLILGGCLFNMRQLGQLDSMRADIESQQGLLAKDLQRAERLIGLAEGEAAHVEN
jgi:hypothetical protein